MAAQAERLLVARPEQVLTYRPAQVVAPAQPLTQATELEVVVGVAQATPVEARDMRAAPVVLSVEVVVAEVVEAAETKVPVPPAIRD